jgi:tetratricopeptide (TPR) repeat protein
MKKVALAAVVFLGLALGVHAQRSNVIAVFQLIETEKYDEAKKAVQAAIVHKNTRDWPRTWYARGVLCQTAYEKGIKEKDKKKYELYPDQLFEAHRSYEKALQLDKHGRLDKQVAPLYVQLANDFISMGQTHYSNEEYAEALKAFEHALDISRSPLLTVETDTSLIYNAALAAYHVKNWDKASEFLQVLNDYQHSPNVPHLLFKMYMQNNDTTAAEEVLFDAASRYNYDKDLVLVLADHLYKSGRSDQALSVLDSAVQNDTANYIFLYTKGLIHQKTGQYEKAISNYKGAIRSNPDEIEPYVNIGNCYYNIGVELKEKARTIVNNRAYLQERKKSNQAFRYAATWLEKAREKDPDNRKLTAQLNELYKVIRLDDEISSDTP